MAFISERMVVISFDAANRTFAVNPNPVRLKPGKHKLYFALETRNRGDADPAVLTQVYEDNLLEPTECVGTCDQLRCGEIVNDPPVTQMTTYNYTVRVCYDGVNHGHDPSVVLEPPPPPD